MFLFAPDKEFLVGRNIDESVVGVSSTTILHEILSLLHYLHVLVFDQRLVKIKIEKRSYSFEGLLYILGVCLELLLADAEEHFFEFVSGVLGCDVLTLLNESFDFHFHFLVDSGVVVECV